MTNYKLLRAAIGESGLPLEMIAKETGLSLDRVKHFENYKKEFRASQIIDFVRVLNLTTEQMEMIFFP